MKVQAALFLISLTIPFVTFGQSNSFEVNETLFSFKKVTLDSWEENKNVQVALYRNGKKLLTHTLFHHDGDCSSYQVQIGNYMIKENKIIFHSYWAATDRMPSSILPFGFREQIYTVDSSGIVRLTEAKIYLEEMIFSEYESYIEDGGWGHKGFKYLNKTPINKYEERLLADYMKGIEKEYNADFVLGNEKKGLEGRIRSSLKKEIDEHTGKWVEGEIYGRIKK